MSIKVQIGDVFFTHSQTTLGKLIRWAETDRNETVAAWANHTGVFVTDGVTPGDAQVVEALWKVRKGPLEPGAGVKVRIYRPATPLSVVEKVIFKERAAKYVGDSYGWWKLLVQLADRVAFGGAKVFSSLMFVDSRPICSYLAAHVFDSIGLGFGMDPDAADPDSMMRYCDAHPTRWIYLGEVEF